MKNLSKKIDRRLKKRILNIAILLIFSIIAIATYYTANFSKAKDIVEVSVNIKNTEIKENEDELIVNATEGSDGESFYVKLPEYVNNKKVIKYTYYTEEEQKEETIQEETLEEEQVTSMGIQEESTQEEPTQEEIEDVEKKEEIPVNEIGPNDVLPESKIYLTSGEVRDKKLTVLAHYDTKEVDGKILYNQLLSKEEYDKTTTVTGYMPENAILKIEEIEKEEIENKIREQTSQPIVISNAYDIKIQVDSETYNAYETPDNFNVNITSEILINKEVNIWHMSEDGQIEKIENQQQENNTTFQTKGFSTFALEDVAATAISYARLTETSFVVDDEESDRYYYLGKNYTDDIAGTNSGKYTDSTLAKVTIKYYGYANGETNAEKVGFISLTERYNTMTYHKVCPIENGKIAIELIENPFIDRPTGFGFGGWTSTSGTITKDSKTKVQTISVNSASNVTIDVYANWVTATVVYVNPSIGIDNRNTGKSPSSPLGSWGAALSYLRTNTSSASDRERNILVLTGGNLTTSINSTRPIVYKNNFTASTTFTSGETYILATDTGAGANAFTANGTTRTNTVLSDYTEPPLTAQWKITKSGDGYTIQNASSGYYFVYSSGPKMQTTPKTWYYSDRSFYTQGTNDMRYFCWYTATGNPFWSTAPESFRTKLYFVKYTKSKEVQAIQNNTSYTSSTNIAFTLTSLYNHTDYRNNNAKITLKTTNYQDFKIYNDFQMDYVNVSANNYQSMTSGSAEASPYMYGNNHNVRLGRGLYPLSDSTTASTFATVFGGSTTTSVGSTSNTNNAYKLVVETGKYSQIQAYHGYTYTNNYYGSIYTTWGNDIDRINSIDNQLRVYYRSSVNIGRGTVGQSDARKPAYIINVKSGSFGYDYVSGHSGSSNNTYAGIYVGGSGVATTAAKDISDRYAIIEGGKVYNLIGGLKTIAANKVETRMYVKGGRVENIVGGAGLTVTYNNRIIQVTGGVIGYSVSGGSNGVYSTSTSADNGKLENSDSLVYIGGNAKIGDEANLSSKLYEVETGCVLGAGNGNNSATEAGQVNNSHIIIDQQAHILNSVYGGGNYGVVGASTATTAKAVIDILGGTIDKNVYGGANQSNIYGATTINMKDGHVKGTVYGGSNTRGTISKTSQITITGGTIGKDGNTSDNAVLFGGGYGANTTVTGNGNVKVLDTDKNVKIYGSIYGGSSLGKMNGNVTINVKDVPTSANTISISGYIFGGGKGSASTAAIIGRNTTVHIDGSNLPNTLVFGGNDINGTSSGDITVNIGKTYSTNLLSVYGGGNKANITTETANVRVYLLANANLTNAFNGGKAAGLAAASSTDTSRAIYLQGGKVTNIFGGSDTSGTVTVSHVYIESGTSTNVYGGNNIGGITTTSNVSITGGTVTNVYGGGYQAQTTASNVILTGGNISNGFGGGNAANVTNSSITLSGTNSTYIYGGSNQKGTVNKSNVTINSGKVTNVFGGNNAGGNSIDTEVNVKSEVANVYGGGNEAITSGNTVVNLINATVTGSAYGGGNGTAAVVTGNSTINATGATNIAGDLFGGGNAAANGTTEKASITTVNISGAVINGDVYGAANTAVVNGQTNVKIGALATGGDKIKGNIDVAGTVFGGGKSNKAGSEDYDFNFESVTGDVTIYMDGRGYDDGTNTINIRGSIFGSGNAAKISGNGYINLAYYGSADNLKTNVSIQRATRVKMNHCGIYLSGTTDRTNEISSAVYTFNRIHELVIKNDTTLYLESGANLLEKLVSVDNNENKAEVKINDSGIVSRNVDNRIYLLQGKNLILRTEDGAHGEVSGMTYVGLYKGTINRITGIFNPKYSEGDPIPDTEEEFARNSFVQGKHYETHNIEEDGFYTNYNEEGVIDVRYITPTPEVGAYYQWIVGKPTDDIYYENIELIATKYATTSTHVLELTGLNYPNMTLEVTGFDTSDLKESVEFTNQSDIPNVEMDKAKANSRFSLTMTSGNVGWQTRGTTEFFTAENRNEGTYKGTTQYLSENSNATGSFSIYMASSKNISTTEKLGTVTIKMQAKYLQNEEMIIRNVFVILNISTNNTIKLANDYYEGAITPGKEYTMFPTTNTSITSNSSLSAYYSLYLGNYSTDENYYFDENSTTGVVGYYHCLISSCVLPAKTKITMIDSSKKPVKYYYYIVTPEDEAAGRREYNFTEFTSMGSTNEKYDLDLSYYNRELDILLEEYIFQVDFQDITLTNSLEKQVLTVEMRDIWDNSMKLNVNTDQYPMMFNLFSNKEAIKSVDVSANKDYIYMGDKFRVDLTTEYTYQTENSDIVYDTTHFEDQMGVKITILDGSIPLTSSQLTGIYLEHGGKRYFARYDGSYRLKLADAVSNILTDIMFYTENGELETATYTFKFETFGSIDGVYYSSPIATDTFNIQIINNNYGLSATLDNNSRIIDKATGKTQNDNNQLDFTVEYVSGFTNPKIHISLLRRDYNNIYASTYNLVDLAEYVENTLTATNVEHEYLMTDRPERTQKITLNLKPNIKSGTYKVVFSLYDGDNYIGNVEKMIIIK